MSEKKARLLSVEEKKALAAKLLRQKQQKQQKKQSRAKAKAKKQPKKFPLSYAQQRLWLLDQLDSGNPAYNIPGAIKIEGRINIGVLEQSFRELIQRHEILRTSFINIDGQAYQQIHPAPPFSLPIYYLEQTTEEAILQRALAEARKSFDLSKGSLLRAGLLKISDDYHVLLITMHHIISDGWSMGIFIQEISQLYYAFCQSKPSPLPELDIQYVDFAVWQRQWLQGDVYQQQLDFWQQQLQGLSVLELPTDYPRPAIQTMNGATIRFHLKTGLSEQLENFCQQQQVTPFMLFLAVFQILLARYSGQDDIAVGTPIAGRNRAETEGLIGFFVNTLVMRADLSQNPAFVDFLQATKQFALQAYAHQDLPFETLVDSLQPEREMSHSPLFQAMFVLQNTPSQAPMTTDVKLSVLEVDSKVAKFDLTLNMVQKSQGFAGVFEYNTDLFKAETIERLNQHFALLLEGIISQSNQACFAIPCFSEQEQQQLLYQWNQTEQSYEQITALQQWFEQQVAQTPNNMAVVFETTELSYQQLNQQANQLAHYLRILGVSRDDLIAIYMDRCAEMVVALLAVLKAGGAYIPIDTSYPMDRVEWMLEDANVRVLLSLSGHVLALELNQTKRIDLDNDETKTMLVQCSEQNPGLINQAQDLAYIIYTSGSTGRPKGVMIPHRAIINHMQWMAQTFPLSQNDKVLQKTPFSFDASVWEFYAPLLAGATLVLAKPGGHQDPDYLLATIEQYQITVLQVVPSLLRMLLLSKPLSALKHLTRLFAGGEALGLDLVETLQQQFDMQIINLYGPTECTIDATYFICDKAMSYGRIPLGQPVANLRCYVLDHYEQLAPIGVPGELYIAGAGLARGYYNKPELTSERFITHPLLSQERIYKTGDKVRYLENGLLDYLGRMDFQVKLRGYRIELEEIEARLHRHALVKEAVVIVREDLPGHARLVAYVVVKDETDDVIQLLKAHLQASLPDYMVPAIFMGLDALPVLPNGKVNRQALPVPDADILALVNEFIEPRNPTEVVVAQIWQQILGLEKVGVYDNFFELGGHSLLATQMVAQVRQQLSVEISLRTVFEAPTIDQLAEKIEQLKHQQQGISLPPLQAMPREEFIPLSFAQERLWFLDQLDPGNAIYNISSAVRLIGDLNIAALEQAFAMLVKRHQSLRTRFVKVDGLPRQKIDEQAVIPLVHLDLQAYPETEQQHLMIDRAFSESQKGFDLANDVLVRVSVLSLQPKNQVLLITMHHIISDGWSNGVLVRELAVCYQSVLNQQAVQLPDLDVQYADFALWQRQWLQGEVLEQQLNYWKQQLAGIPERLYFPTDYTRPEIQTFHGAHQSFHYPKELLDQLYQLSRQQGCTLFMTLLTAYAVLLAYYSRQQDVCIGSPIAGRHQSGTENIIGFFVNALIFRIRLADNPSFEQLLQQVKATTLDAYSQQDLPFEMLVEALSPQRNLAYAPLAQVGFALQNLSMPTVALPEIRLEPMEFETGTAKYELMLIAMETEQGLQGALEYNTDLFKKASIQRLLQQYQTLLQSFVAEPQQLLSEISLVKQQELYQLFALEPERYEKILPLSPMQRDLYLETLLHPDTLQNSLGVAIQVQQPFDLVRWKKVLQGFANSQPILRSRVIGSKLAYTDVAYQAIIATEHYQLDFDHLDMSQRYFAEAEVIARLNQKLHRPYDLHQDHLIQPGAIQLSDDKWILYIAAHHMILDGVAITHYLLEACACYQQWQQNQSYEFLAALFEDYLIQSRHQFDRSETQQFWKKQLGDLSSLDFSVAEELKRSELISQRQLLPSDHWKQVKQYCRANKMTPAIYFKGLYGLLLAIYCRADQNFAITEYLAGRPKGHQQSLGCYYQALPFVFDYKILWGELSGLWQYIKGVQKGLGEHKNISLLVQQQLMPQSRLQFSYNFYHFPAVVEFLQQSSQIQQAPPPVAKGQVQFIVKVVGEELGFELNYHGNEFSELEFLERLQYLSQQIINGADDSRRLKWLATEEYQAILPPDINPDLPYQAIQQWFEHQVELTPDAIAVIYQDQSLSYQQLNQQVNQWAHYLKQQGVDFNICVGLCVERSPLMLIGLLAILKAGGAYLPMDSHYPIERLAYMLKDANVYLLLTQSSLRDKLPDHQGKIITLDKPELVAKYSTENLDLTTQTQHLAYVIYTSGSTGQPKGAGVYHQGEINLLQWYIAEFAMSASDKTLLISAFGFDLTQKNLLAPLMSGGCLVIPAMDYYDENLVRELLFEQQITLLNCAPSMFYPLVEGGDFLALQSLRYLFLGGEPIVVSKLQAWMQSEEYQCHIVNTYGPTECTDIAAYYVLDNDLDNLPTIIPIGQANSNVQLYVLDDQQRLLPKGLIGELAIGGLGVGFGYLNDELKTKQKFLANPFAQGQIYLTGDLVRYRQDGLLEFIMRKDHQIKLRGLRIELGEIECSLAQQAGVKDCLVIVKEEQILAYIITLTELDLEQLQTKLADYLPSFMLPSHYILLTQWPLTPNGKIDRKALPEPDAKRRRVYEPAKTDIEQALAQYWSELLGGVEVGRFDHFFELGGHSLLATQVMAFIYDRFGLELPLRTLFEAPILRDLAEQIELAKQQGVSVQAPPIVAVSREQALPLSFAQERLWVLDQLTPNNPVYNVPTAVRLEGDLNIPALQQALNAIQQRHETLRTRFIEHEGEVRQHIETASHLFLKIMDLTREQNEAEKQKLVEDYVSLEANKPFNLSKDPLARVSLIVLSEQQYVLLLTLHHIISDGWSLGVFVQELVQYYQAFIHRRPVPLPELKIQYADYAYWQRNWLKGEVLQDQLNWWQQELAHAPKLLTLPTDRPRPATQSFAGAQYSFQLPLDLSEQLNEFCQQQGLTLYMVLLGAWAILLSRYSGMIDVCIGTPLAGRTRSELEGLIGFFINGLVMRVKLEGNPSILELLQRVKTTSLGVYAHQDVSAEQILDVLNIERHLSYTPVAQVAFALQNLPSQAIELPDLDVQPMTTDTATAKYDITLFMTEAPQGLFASFEYSVDLFDVSTMVRMAEHYQTILEQMMADANQHLLQLSLVHSHALYKLLDLEYHKVDAIYPLSTTQRDMYLESVRFPDSLYNSIGYGIELEDFIDQTLWLQALQQVVDFNPIMRTQIAPSQQPYLEMAYQYVLKPAPLSIEKIELDDHYSEAQFKQFLHDWVYVPWQIHHQPLVHHGLLYWQGRCFNLLRCHHILLDGASSSLILNFTCQIYQQLLDEQSPNIDTTPFHQYIDYNRSHFDTDEIIKGWQQRFVNAEALDYPVPAKSSQQAMRRNLSIPATHWSVVKTFCRKQRITPAMYFRAIYGLLLKQYCRPESDFVVTEVSGSRFKQFNKALGSFFQDIPLVFRSHDMQGQQGITDYLQQVKSYLRELGELKNISSFEQNQLLQYGRIRFYYNYFNFKAEIKLMDRTLPILQHEVKLPPNQVLLVVNAGLEPPVLGLEYHTDYFDDLQFLERILELSQQILEGTQRLEQLNYVLAKEKILFQEWNATSAELPAINNPVQWIQAQAQKTPDAIAVIQGQQQLSYQQLNQQANQFAHYLQQQGIEANQVVAVCLPRCPKLLVAFVAIWKLGAGYLPLDPSYPKERLAYMLQDANAKLLVSQQDLLRQFQQTGIALEQQSEIWQSDLVNDLAIDYSQQHLAYIIYTSGSTGQPKGAGVKQQGVINLLAWYRQEFSMTASDKTLIISAIGFDLTQKNLFALLTVGGTVVLAEDGPYHADNIRQQIADNQISLLNCAPSMFYPLVETSTDWQSLQSLRYVFLGGEAIVMDRLATWWQQSNSQLVNTYGPTECTDISAFYRVQTNDQMIPIGQANRNVQLYVCNSQQQLVPIGVVGELCIGGLGVGLGYLNDSDKTQAKFITTEFANNQTVYRSGDLVRYLDNGLLQFMGRVDHQIKLRGLRIELGEIEFALKQQVDIDDALVMVMDEQLVAYVITTESIDAELLQQNLADYLPDYMIPQHYLGLTIWPLTPNGKIDRKALPAPQKRQVYVAPRNQVEQDLVGIWQQLLGLDHISVEEHFFALGGHSLLATQLMTQIRQQFGLEFPLQELFQRPTIAKIAEKIIELQQLGQISAQVIPVVDRSKRLPLSFAQERLWFIHQLDPSNIAYHMPSALRLEGQLNVNALQQAVIVLVKRHEVLRTALITDEQGIAYQQIVDSESVAESTRFHLEIEDLSHIPRKQQDIEVLQQVNQLAKQPFDLSQAPLWRMKLLLLATQHYALVLNMHHIISDGWSISVFVKELAIAYQACQQKHQANLPRLAIQYADYAYWQRQWLQGEELERQLNYWQQQLADVPVLQMPSFIEPDQTVRNTIDKLTGATLEFELATTDYQSLTKLAQSQGVTLFMLMLSIYQILLARYSQQNDFAIGTPIAGRHHASTEELIGLFVNTLALRLKFDPKLRFVDWLKQVQATAVEAYAHQDLPFEKIVDALALPRDMDHSPVFQVMFSLQNTQASTGQIPELKFSAIDLEVNIAKFGLALTLTQTEQGLIGVWEYQTHLFTVNQMADLNQRWLQLVAAIATDTNSSTAIGYYPLLIPAERLQLQSWNQTHQQYPLNFCLHQWIEALVEQMPDRVAVQFEGQCYSYQELNQKANQLAHYLHSEGMTANSLVGICMWRQLDLMVAILGVLKAGAAYLPLDPDYPQDRLAYMLEDGQVSLVLTEQGLIERFPSTQATLFCFDKDWERIELLPTENAGFEVALSYLAYVIYTSGSTGLPKGVMISHQAIVNHMLWMNQTYPLSNRDKVLQKTPFSFDASVWEFFAPLMQGASLVFAKPGGHQEPDYLIEVIQQQNITVLQLVPSLLQMIVAMPNYQDIQLKRLFCGGEALTVDLVKKGFEIAAEVINLYGPTECTIDATHYHCQIDDKIIPIGQPIANLRAYILDTMGQAVPVGVIGELYFAGTGLAKGYWQRPQLTEQRFVSIDGIDEVQLYQTGDLARFLEDGNIEYCGRKDQQVKLRGYRIELEEIASLLTQHADIQQAVVIVREDQVGIQRLVAYLVADKDKISLEALRNLLKQQLPDYMVPTAFVYLEALPFTPSGKLDRKALAPPEEQHFVRTQTFVAPSTEAETILANIWQQVLGLEQVGIYDNFFELGGDSILSIQVVSRAKQQGLALTPRQLFENQTLIDLASVAGTAVQIHAEQGLVTGDYELTPIQQRFLAQDLFHHNQWNQALLLTVKQPIALDHLEESIAFLVKHHDILRSRFERIGDQWQAQILENETRRSVLYLNLAALETDPLLQSEAITQAAAQAQASLNIEQGPLLRVVYIDLGEQAHRLLFVFHHLVVDGVSWRIILEDLQLIFHFIQQDKLPILAAKTTAFPVWSARLQQYAQTLCLDDLWSLEGIAKVKPLPKDYPDGSNQVKQVKLVQLSLSAELTHKLLQQVPAVYHTQINDILLTALLLAYYRWSGESTLLLHLESHGRADLFDDIDISRTVGWFTSLYPILLSLSSEDYSELIPAIKEYLRQVNDLGINYGLLRYVHNDSTIRQTLANMPQAEISFNYLGQLDSSIPETEQFASAKESAAYPHHPEYQREHLIDINSSIVQGSLGFAFAYSKAIYDKTSIESFAEAMIQSLTHLIQHCLKPNTGGFSPSDFPLANLDQPTINQWLGKNRNIQDIYPLSPMQQGMLFHSLYSPESGVYLEQLSCILQGQLNIPAFQQAWQHVVDRHDILRTAFFWDKTEQPLQVVYRQVTLPLAQLDWQDKTTDVQQQQWQQLVQSIRQQGLDLNQSPLMHLVLVKLSNDCYRLLWSHHHLLMDGWSLPLLLQEVLISYQALDLNQTINLSRSHGYGRYIQWLANQDMDKAKQFWQSYLQGFVTPTPCFIDTLPKEEPSSETQQHVALSPEHSQALEQRVRQHKITLNGLVQAVWALVLSRYSGEDDVVFGSVVAGRPPELTGVESMIGLFINTLPIRFRLDIQQSLLSVIQKQQQQQAEMRQYEYTPLAQIQQWSSIESGQALFESVLVFENYPVEAALTQQQSNLSISEVESKETTNFPLTLQVSPGKQLILELKYQAKRFAKAPILRLLGHLEQVLIQVIDKITQPMSQLSLLTKAEFQQITMDWNQTQIHYEQPECLQQLFEQQLIKTPEAIALRFEDHCLSYRQLEEQANQLAHHLQKLGIQANDKVGVFTLRSIEMVVALYAILKAGAAYLPLDPDYPADRLEYMLDDAKVAIVLTHQLALNKLPNYPGELLILDDDSYLQQQDDYPVTRPELRSTHKDLAYVIYTSGSTGKPKGTLVSHKAIINRLLWMQQTYQLTASDKVLQKTPYSFDVSVWEFFWPLFTGASLVIAKPEGHKDPDYLNQIIQTEQITTLHFVPSMLSLFLQATTTAQSTSLKYVICSGEALPLEYQHRFFQVLPQVELHNLYGPTEAAVDVTWWQCRADNPYNSVPIGKPIANTRCYILDVAGHPVPIGVPGELLLGGVQLAEGYLNRPELTAEKFIAHPWLEGERLYRTGDLTRYLPDGNIEYIGRIDFQVKLRGLRIELGEIETVLNQLDGIKETAVIVYQDNLIAYCVGEQQPIVDIQAQLAQQLPEFMIPSHIMFLEQMPLSPNGKLDRKALPKPDTQQRRQKPYVAPRNVLETQLVEVWQELLQHQPIGVYDSFFELGGHSLLAVQMMVKIQQRLGKEVALAHLLQNSDIASLAKRLEGDQSVSCLVPLQAQGDNPPIFCIHALGGVVLSYLSLAQEFGTEQAVYGLQALGIEANQQALTSVEAMAEYYLALIKTVQAQGPYYLIGHSFGGLIALEMAKTLTTQQQAVKLVLLDTLAPDYYARQRLEQQSMDWSELQQTLTNMLQVDIEIDWQSLATLTMEQQIDTILNSLQQQFADLDMAMLARVLKVNQTNFLASQQYQPSPYSGEVMLYRAQQRPDDLDQDDGGWGNYLENLELTVVAGDHNSLLELPQVTRLVALIKQWL